MSSFGMQMPGGRLKRSASMNIYTGLLFCAVLALAVACGFMWVAAKKVGVTRASRPIKYFARPKKGGAAPASTTTTPKGQKRQPRTGHAR